MDDESPLRFLDYDVTQYIYDTYYPSKEAKENKKKMNEQFLTIKNKYLSRYKIDNIYGYEIMFCIRGYLYKKISFSSFLNELNGEGVIKKNKMRLPYLFNCIKPLSYFRANQYKNESLYLKALVNIIH
tara:strand:- start:250 stop:633 length:384 start_codon:yes stop_codon:yes gene_type:complete